MTPLNILKPKPTYTIQIAEITEGEHDNDFCLVECSLKASNDETATAIFNDLFLAVAKHSHLPTDRLNGNIYKTQWLNGI